MTVLIHSIMVLLCVVIGVGCWLGWQLLRQNGRILLRLDEVEKRFDELELGEPAEPDGLVNGQKADPIDARPRHEPYPLTPDGGEGARRAGEGEVQDRASRFNNRSLARSRIKRDGLKAGTPAPDFRLPRLDGTDRSLQDFRGRGVLLVFSDPHCGPCNTLAPELERFHRDHTDIAVVMISRGEPRQNRAKVKEHGLTFPILLQQQWEISRRYAMFAMPIAYVIDERGIIAADVAVGVDRIQTLLSADAREGERFRSQDFALNSATKA